MSDMVTEQIKIPLEKIDDCRYRIPKSFKKGMRVDGMVYANEELLKDIFKDKAIEQVINAAFLPGIVGHSMAMPDVHWGYGFPIGGVAATDLNNEGVISPGGVGFDINCGVRCMRSEFVLDDIKDHVPTLMKVLFRNVPSGVGSTGNLRLKKEDEKRLLREGSKWIVQKGFGTQDDLEATEDEGAIAGANPEAVSERAYARGKDQVGTLGSGNHFLEIQVIDEIYDEDVARALNLFKNQITVMIHCGSRGLGHQICDDYCRIMDQAMRKYLISMPDRQLACAPVKSREGTDYLGAMRCAANYAWANRQLIMHKVRESFEAVFKKSWTNMGLQLVYDVAHNIAKIEKHDVDGQGLSLCVHRKGATRAFPPGHPALAKRYQAIGQPVIIPGDMGRNSYLLVGQESGAETFYSCCHGAGRVMSRMQAKKRFHYGDIIKDLKAKGITLEAQSAKTVTEEAPLVYKDVTEVVGVVQKAGLAKKVCRMRPLGVMKG
ncbi:MAG: RtcB family protein [Candidatus Omnitrophota bacterium]